MVIGDTVGAAAAKRWKLLIKLAMRNSAILSIFMRNIDRLGVRTLHRLVAEMTRPLNEITRKDTNI